MSLEVFKDIEQRSEEWHKLRLGLLTASVMRHLITNRALGALDFACPACGAAAASPCLSKVSKPDQEPKPIKTLHPERTAHAAANKGSERVIEVASNDDSRSLTLGLAAERITGWTDPTFFSLDMQRGVEEEPRSREHYSKTRAPVTEVGLMVREGDGFRVGWSPDGLVGDDGCIEIKAPRTKRHIQTVITRTVPPENMAQVQTALWVSGREWCDFVSWVGGLPMFVKRVGPDARWFEAIEAAARKFEIDVQQIVESFEQETYGLPMTERSLADVEIF